MGNQEVIAQTLAHFEREQHLSGAILVSRAREVVFEHAYGLASRQLGVPNTLATKFHIASATKMFIAMAALVLTEQGRIALHERPGTYVPELAALDPTITLHHLLSHTSGIPDIYNVPNLRFAMHQLNVEQGSFLAYLIALPPLFRPGEGWSYSTTGFIFMGYIIEQVTGMPFEEVLRRSVLAPLSMANTGIDLPRRITPRRAYGHNVEDGQFVNSDNDKLSIFPEAPGELYSTVQDLKLWCDALFDCPLVSPPTLELMFTPHARVDDVREFGPDRHYGYGWFLAPGFRFHGGQTPGFRALIRQYPEQRLSMILLLNSDHLQPWTIASALEPLLVG